MTFSFLAFSCAKNPKPTDDPISGWWKAELSIDSSGLQLPFFLVISNQEGNWMAHIINGDEQILHDDVTFKSDTLRIMSPVFNSEIIAHLDQNKLIGYWQDYSRGENYRIPFRAKYNLPHRFSFENSLTSDLNGQWKTVFSPNTEKSDTAIAVFRSVEDDKLLATFLTKTGDYRFLEGGYDGQKLQLSAFDGSHAFLFRADMRNDTLFGKFYSGSHWKEDFISWKDPNYQLNDPYQLTGILDTNEALNLKLMSTVGLEVDISDKEYENQPLIIQIMGSWCPNCMDESVFLSRNQKKIAESGVKIVAVAFERNSFDKSTNYLERYRNNLGIEYPILYGGTASKEEAAKLFPQIEHVLSFPTTLFLNSDHTIYKVHTGYNGPSTGKYFDHQNDQFWRSVAHIDTIR